MKTVPTLADIEAAYLHGRWLRGQECTGEGRMLADLSVEVQQHRARLTPTARELDTILAALRSWQVRNLPSVPAEQRAEIELLAREHGPALDAEEIDSLCDKLNR